MIQAVLLGFNLRNFVENYHPKKQYYFVKRISLIIKRSLIIIIAQQLYYELFFKIISRKNPINDVELRIIRFSIMQVVR